MLPSIKKVQNICHLLPARVCHGSEPITSRAETTIAATNITAATPVVSWGFGCALTCPRCYVVVGSQTKAGWRRAELRTTWRYQAHNICQHDITSRKKICRTRNLKAKWSDCLRRFRCWQICTISVSSSILNHKTTRCLAILTDRELNSHSINHRTTVTINVVVWKFSPVQPEISRCSINNWQD